MADNPSKDNQNTEEPPVNYGYYILQELQRMNKLLGLINQTMTQKLKLIEGDVELCRVTLSKIKKMSQSEISVSDNRSSPPTPSSIPSGPKTPGF